MRTRRRQLRPAALLLPALLLSLAKEAQSQGFAVQAPNVLAVPQPAGAPVKSIRTLREAGGRVDWSHQRDLIAYDRLGDDGYYGVYTMHPDGSNEVCLTCDKPGIPSKHKGNPAWHPTGDYIAFQSEKQDHLGSSEYATPGIGLHNDLWVMTSDGDEYFQLTDASPWMRVLHPHFSHDGSRLLWSELVELATGNWQWVLNMADFVVSGNGPQLANVTACQPLGPTFYESHGFTHDDTGIIFTAFLWPQQWAWSWFDIYTYDLETGRLNRLTYSIRQWDEHATYSPQGDKVAWVSSIGCTCNPFDQGDLSTDLWLMNADGSDKTRLTYYGDPSHPEYTVSRSLAADSAWSPDGRRLVLYVQTGTSEGRPYHGRIDLIELADPQ